MTNASNGPSRISPPRKVFPEGTLSAFDARPKVFPRETLSAFDAALDGHREAPRPRSTSARPPGGQTEP